ncbi:hypothetical protein E3P99_01800, partial [Wallemia hederae]
SDLTEITNEAHRLLAIGNYAEASNKYSDALEIVREKHGEMSSESAALLLKYGESLYLHAVSQSNVIGKGEDAEDDGAAAAAEPSAPSGSGATGQQQQSNLIQLSDDEDEEGDDGEPDGGEGGEEEGAPDDDDFGAAWEVADLAKVIYQKMDGDDNKLALADAHMLLGDIALELETFEDAATEYNSSLNVKKDILTPQSRILAEAHFKLAISYELIPGHVKRDEALVHVKAAKEVLEGRLDALKKRVEANSPVEEAGQADKPALRERVERLSVDDANKQITDIGELIGDLTEKIVELEQPPPPASEDPSKSTVDALVAEMDKARQTVASDAPVNVLQPKKKQEKRKAEDDNAGDADKKSKTAASAPAAAANVPQGSENQA